MSTYNGGNKITRQIASILAQINVDVNIKIRDDGSNEETAKVISELKAMYPDKLDCTFGDNLGYKLSFMDLLYKSSLNFDYYAFSDQDDIWLPEKLISCINLIDDDSKPALVHCNALSVDENLKIRNEQEYRIAYPPNHEMAITTEFFQGCGMVWNKELMKLLQTYKPQNKSLAHDFWVGIIGYLFGDVYFNDKVLFYHIRYTNNESSDGNILKGRIKRIKSLFGRRIMYMNPAKDLLEGFNNYLSEEDKLFLNRIITYKNSWRSKFLLITDNNFRRPSKGSTIFLKFVTMINRF